MNGLAATPAGNGARRLGFHSAPLGRLRKLLLALNILTPVAYILTAGCAHASQAPRVAAAAPSNGVPPAATGPAALRRQVRVTVETNAPPLENGTNSAPAKKTSFEWKAWCVGWDGLHLQLTRQTLLGRYLPGVTNLVEPHLDKVSAIPGVATSGLRLHLEEDRLTMKIGGSVAFDGSAFITGPQFHGFDDGIQLRRFRAYAQGDCLLVLPVSYEFEIGYVPNTYYIQNSYVAFRDIGLIGELKFGQYQAPMGLDVVTSGRDISEMEPAAVLQALAPGVNAGVQMGRPLFEQRATWKFGFFTAGGGGQDFGEASKSYGRAITRLTGLPLYAPDPGHPGSATLLHLGLSANILYSTDDSIRYRSRPENHLGPYVVDTGSIKANGSLVAGAEAAWVSGPFSIQAEYLQSWVNDKNGQSPSFGGAYASASWFLTGETRPYDRQNGCFTRVVPQHNFNWGRGGWGAWELAARCSCLDLDSANVHGGRLSEFMVGPTWYLHSHLKWRFEYGLADVTHHQPEGIINIFQTRMEVDF